MNTKVPAGKPEPSEQLVRFWRVVYSLLIALAFVAVTVLVLLFPILPSRQYDLQPGNLAAEDIHAPREITYTSTIETQAAREAARASVAEIYDPPDPRIGRQQVRKARLIMDFVQDVRADPFADLDLKLEYLRQITALPPDLPPEVTTTLLSISESQFEQVEGEVVSLVEEAMSGTVREGHITAVTDQLELKVSPELPEDLIPLSVAVSRNLVVPNSLLNADATEVAKKEAEDAVPEIKQTFLAGEVVVRAGEPVDDLDLEALKVLGLATSQLTWKDVASAILISLLSVVATAVYLAVFDPEWADQPRYLLLIGVLTLIFLVVAQIMVPGQRLTAYLFPAAALSLALTEIVGIEFGSLVIILLAILAGFMADRSLEMTVYLGLSGAMAAGGLRRGGRLNSFFLAGIYTAIIGAGVLMVFRLPVGTDSVRLAQLLLMSLLNGLLSAGIALVILYVVGSVIGVTTSLQLVDLMRPDHPLQKRLQQEALGTYQHTLSVANLAEAAAEAIGANSLLTRVGTLYHDIGKMSNPGFFVENRTEGGTNPHDRLSPLTSARIIKAHVADGVDLARRHRLPPEVTAFIPEHHGTMPILFFLNKAREEAAEANTEVNESDYCYDGPIPQSRETAILMLADGCESAVRANRPTETKEIEAIVMRIIQQRLDLHQLDMSGLTMTDITTIKDTFVRTLKGMYHPRVRYPGDKKPAPLPVGHEAALPPPGSDYVLPVIAADADMVAEAGTDPVETPGAESTGTDKDRP
jgi:putative nucleotidyltransferase with HDIG domain